MRTAFGTKVASGERGGTVRSLYEAALREVKADPVAAMTKYQPTWLAALSPATTAARPAASEAKRTRPPRSR